MTESKPSLFPVSLDQSIDPENEVRLIDLFAESLSLQKLGFRTQFVDNGRPAYQTGLKKMKKQSIQQ